MKQYLFILLLLPILITIYAACTGQQNTVIILPDPEQDKLQEQTNILETGEIIETQNGPGESGIPVWVRLYLDGKIREIESLDAYSGKYVFIGKNRGEHFNALQQWANNFAITQDFPRLIVPRVEQRFIASATLYPDDEYGEYFSRTIKKVSDEEYSRVAKEQVFWIKKKITIINEEDPEMPQISEFERYDFFVLVSIDKETLQRKIREIMADIKTSPTRDQAAAIQKINRTFFEGF
ncbi:MAG: hypothetical protein FWD36_09220 [Treponema sp.]|nr:hypothetical protein [Treponema sp.]